MGLGLLLPSDGECLPVGALDLFSVASAAREQQLASQPVERRCCRLPTRFGGELQAFLDGVQAVVKLPRDKTCLGQNREVERNRPLSTAFCPVPQTLPEERHTLGKVPLLH